MFWENKGFGEPTLTVARVPSPANHSRWINEAEANQI